MVEKYAIVLERPLLVGDRITKLLIQRLQLRILQLTHRVNRLTNIWVEPIHRALLIFVPLAKLALV